MAAPSRSDPRSSHSRGRWMGSDRGCASATNAVFSIHDCDRAPERPAGGGPAGDGGGSRALPRCGGDCRSDRASRAAGVRAGAGPNHQRVHEQEIAVNSAAIVRSVPARCLRAVARRRPTRRRGHVVRRPTGQPNRRGRLCPGGLVAFPGPATRPVLRLRREGRARRRGRRPGTTGTDETPQRPARTRTRCTARTRAEGWPRGTDWCCAWPGIFAARRAGWHRRFAVSHPRFGVGHRFHSRTVPP